MKGGQPVGAGIGGGGADAVAARQRLGAVRQRLAVVRRGAAIDRGTL